MDYKAYKYIEGEKKKGKKEGNTKRYMGFCLFGCFIKFYNTT